MTTTTTRTRNRPRSDTTLTGLSTLVRLALYRDRLRLTVWIVSMAMGALAVVATVVGGYAEGELSERAETLDSPALVAISGPRIGLDNYTVGALLTNEIIGYFIILLALMSIFTVIRHTRADEDAGRAEVLRSNVVGRHAALAAALIVAIIANLTLAVVLVISLVTAGDNSVTWAGSWLATLAMAGSGIFFAAITAIVVQLRGQTTSATAFATIILFLAYAIRAVGDVTGTWVSWLSPFAWAQRTYAYVDNSWWPLLIPVVLGGVAALVAVDVSSRRDVGVGLWPDRGGAPRASRRLATPLGLRTYHQRGGLVGWGAILIGLGLLYGPLIGEADNLARQSRMVADILEDTGGSNVDALIAHLIAVSAILAATYGAIFLMLRARSDELQGLVEPVLSTGVTRNRWLWSYVGPAMVSSVALLLASSLALGVTAAFTLNDASIVPTVLLAALVYVPSILLTISIAIFFFGLFPAYAFLATWIVIGYALTIGKLGEMLGVGGWAPDLSPFTMVARYPAEQITALPMIGLFLVTVVLIYAGFGSFRTRDLMTTV